MFFALQSISETSEDSKISTDVRGLLELHTDLGPPNSIHVNTIKHVVYLSGLVGTGLGDREAEDIARQAPGVARVVNSVAVEQ
jgi:osmotically-inducible protein OsmY